MSRHAAASGGSACSPGPVEYSPPPPMKNSGCLWHFERNRRQRAIGARGSARWPVGCAAAGPMTKPLSAIPSGCEDVLAHVRLERLAAHRLDGLADPVDVDAVFPALAWIADQRCGQRRFLHSMMPGSPACSAYFADVRVPDVVAEPRRVGEQMAQCDGAASATAAVARPRRRSRPAPATAASSAHLGHRRIEREPALLDQLHAATVVIGLGHRGDPAHRVQRHLNAAPDLPLAGRAGVNESVLIRGKGDNAGHIAPATLPASTSPGPIVITIPVFPPCSVSLRYH